MVFIVIFIVYCIYYWGVFMVLGVFLPIICSFMFYTFLVGAYLLVLTRDEGEELVPGFRLP